MPSVACNRSSPSTRATSSCSATRHAWRRFSPTAATPMAEHGSFFVTDGDGYLPTPLARGPWGPSLAGNYIGGLLARAVEREVDEDDLQPARLTVDLLRPVAQQPLRVHSSMVRNGRRLRLVDA